MKRPIAQTLIVAAILASGACGRPSAPATGDAPVETGWITSPVIDAVASVGSDLSISGTAAPLGRVVISGPGGQAYAVGADDRGAFELRAPRPARDTLFVVEARSGQLSYPAPYRLLVSADPMGPVALLSIGAPTRRLDPGPGLDAVDSDGSSVILTGRAAPGSAVQIEAGGSRVVTAEPDGRWTVAMSGGGGTPVRVGPVAYAPTSGPAGDEGVLERAGEGWKISWSMADGARQTTWLPDRRT